MFSRKYGWTQAPKGQIRKSLIFYMSYQFLPEGNVETLRNFIKRKTLKYNLENHCLRGLESRLGKKKEKRNLRWGPGGDWLELGRS